MFGKWSGTEVTIEGEELSDHERIDIMGILLGPELSRHRNSI